MGDATFEKVHTMVAFYDGPREGIADFEGRLHLYESEWDDEATFLLSPIDEDTFRLAMEAWAIWRRWEAACPKDFVTTFDYKLPGFESNRDGQVRFIRALQGVVNRHPGERILVCTHGNVIVLAIHEFSDDLDPSTEHIDFCEVRRIVAGDAWRYDETFRLPHRAF